jgi:hypothetical protein
VASVSVIRPVLTASPAAWPRVMTAVASHEVSRSSANYFTDTPIFDSFDAIAHIPHSSTTEYVRRIPRS